MKDSPKLVSAFITNANTGVLVFDQDVNIKTLPSFRIQNQPLTLISCNKRHFAETSYYYIEKNSIVFYLPKAQALKNNSSSKHLYLVSGEFNHWGKDINWELRWHPREKAWLLKCPVERFKGHNFAFKFVNIMGQWIEPSDLSPNVICDTHGHRNLLLDFSKTGNHWVQFKTSRALDLTQPCELVYEQHACLVNVLPWLNSFYSQKPLGAHILNDQTTQFACFAPHAKSVSVKVFKDDFCQEFPLQSDDQGVWSTCIEKNFDHYNYTYCVQNPFLQELTDPYAQQLQSPRGPGIIRQLKPLDSSFKTPAISDLVIMEAHVRDLVAHANTPKNESFFAQLNTFFSQNNYVKDLGINCIELMPVTEFDSNEPLSYHWGYMPAHYFALSSTYGTPEEFQACVKTLHDRGIAVILDVVFNHAGNLNDLIKWYKTYYFRHTPSGFMSNCSGCGNDLQTEMPMVKKLILDSCLHLLTTYQVDGFRFDLAELLNLDTLNYLSENIKKIKPEAILIAEPWSFRRHIGYDLKGTPYACWNDNFREFLPKYVNGEGNTDGLKYFLEGSTAYLCQTPQQSINYTESHDDYTWFDRIGGSPEEKLGKTQCMFAILLMSMGIPMLAEGQDFMRSKQGVRNTYNRGDLNLLDYNQLLKNDSLHRYVKGLIRFRKSIWGRLLKPAQPSTGYFHYFYSTNSSALCVLYNADNSLGKQQILFAINPHNYAVSFDLQDLPIKTFWQIADGSHFLPVDEQKTLPPKLELGPLSSVLYTNK